MIKRSLAHRQPPAFLDGRNAGRAIAAITGKDDPNRIRALIVSKRNKKQIHHHAPRFHRRGSCQAQVAVVDGENGARRDNRDGIGHRDHPTTREIDGHGCVAGEDFGQRTFMVRIKMLHEHKGHAAIGRHRGKKGLICNQATRRGANPDNQRPAPGNH
jgi:hypothetical protein